MKIYFLYLTLAMILFGCGARKASVARSKVEVFEKSELTRKAPGDHIFLPAPKIPNPRPVECVEGEIIGPVVPELADTTLFKEGINGSRLRIDFDSRGLFKNAECNCPQVDEEEISTRDETITSKTKDTERQALVWPWYLVTGIICFLLGLSMPWRRR